MQGLMMNRPLKISDIITYAAEAYPSVEIVSVRSEGDIHRTNYLDISKRMAQLAHSLISMGINPGRSRRHPCLEWLSSPRVILCNFWDRGCLSYNQP